MGSRGQSSWKVVSAIALVVVSLAGFYTSSSTFIVGLLVVAAWLLWQGVLRRRPGMVASMGVMIFVLALAIGLIGRTSFAIRSVESEFERAQTYEGLIGPRYSASVGILSGTIEAISRRPVVGWGATTQPGVFLGDSQYVILLYSGGALGLLLFVGALGSIGRRLWRDSAGAGMVFGWLLVLTSAGVGSPSFFIPRLQEWWWAFAGVALALQASRTRLGGAAQLRAASISDRP